MANPLERPTVLTEEVQAKVLHLLGAGNFITTACEASGLNYWTYHHWRSRWEKQDPEDDGANRFAAFFERVNEAIRIGEATALKTLKVGAPGWQAQAWFLERRFPKRWGKKVEVVDARNVEKLTDEQLEDIAQGKGGG
jgi:hypothetical protein